jgi:hypothetical protein
MANIPGLSPKEQACIDSIERQVDLLIEHYQMAQAHRLYQFMHDQIQAIMQAQLPAILVSQQALGQSLGQLPAQGLRMTGTFVPVPQMGLAGYLYGQAESVKYAGVQVGEILAWRTWRAESTNREYNIAVDQFIEYGKPRLRSVTMQDIWLPDKPMQVHLPIQDYGHGIYALKTRQNAEQSGYFCPGHVLGTVKLWGTVYEHENGFRSEYAQVASLDAIKLDCLDPGWTYGTPETNKMRANRILAELQAEYQVGFHQPPTQGQLP